MAQVQKQLSDVLLEQGLVTAEQLDLAVQEEAKTGRSSWKILLERGAVTERDLVRARAEQIGMQFVDVSAVQPSADVLEMVPGEMARRQMVLPINSENDILVLAMADPRNHLAVNEVGSSSGKQVVPVPPTGKTWPRLSNGSTKGASRPDRCPTRTRSRPTWGSHPRPTLRRCRGPAPSPEKTSRWWRPPSPRRPPSKRPARRRSPTWPTSSSRSSRATAPTCI